MSKNNVAKLTSTYASTFAQAVLANATTMHAKVLGEADGLKAAEDACRGTLVKRADRASAAARLILDADESIIEAGDVEAEQN